ncbi:hypothetical protein R1flu_021782 [Riccia fluitans]|uniref:Uncharacterized protein n=1 Tax=Riccia fluitans TaxID=41844 RepID=A0ABD1ZQD7_9MARC
MDTTATSTTNSSKEWFSFDPGCREPHFANLVSLPNLLPREPSFAHGGRSFAFQAFKLVVLLAFTLLLLFVCGLSKSMKILQLVLPMPAE